MAHLRQKLRYYLDFDACFTVRAARSVYRERAVLIHGACVHSLAPCPGAVSDLLHEHRAAGIVPGIVSGLFGGAAAAGLPPPPRPPSSRPPPAPPPRRVGA